MFANDDAYSILGSSFLKNVYSIFQYPNVNKTNENTWQPTVGLVSLTNASLSSQDFYAVRSLHQSLSSVSAAQQPVSPNSDPSAPTSQSSPAGSTAAGHRIVSTAAIVAGSIVGLFVIAAAVFCAWWFWLRRKHGASHRIIANPVRQRSIEMKSNLSSSSLRNKKHDNMQRQKSMIEGYSDHESGSWLSTTEGGNSIGLGYLPEALEDDEVSKGRIGERSSLGSTYRDSLVEADDVNLVDIADPAPIRPTESVNAASTHLDTRPRETTPSADHTIFADLPSTTDDSVIPSSPSTAAYPQPLVPSSASTRSLQLSMAGPFPSSSRRSNASLGYGVRANDYYAGVAGPVGTNTGRDSRSRSSELREGSGNRNRQASSHHPARTLENKLVEEPIVMPPDTETRW